MSDLSDLMNSISEIRLGGLVPVGLLFLCGVILWAAGRRVMRVGFAAAGLLVGGVLGMALAQGGELGAKPWVAGVAGAVAFAVVAAVAYRLALAGAVALLLAMLAPMGVWTAEQQGLIVFSSQQERPAGETTQPVLATPGSPAIDSTGNPPNAEGSKPAKPLTVSGEVESGLGGLGNAANDVAQRVGALSASDSPKPPANAESGAAAAPPATDPATEEGVAQQLATPVKAAAEVVGSAWSEATPPERGSFVAAGLFGAMLGLVLGTAAPVFSAILVSALGGSFLLLATGWILGARLGIAGESWMPQNPTHWTILWLITAIVGLGIQWIFRPKRKIIATAE